MLDPDDYWIYSDSGAELKEYWWGNLTAEHFYDFDYFESEPKTDIFADKTSAYMRSTIILPKE